MKKNFASLAYLQNYRQLNIITRTIPHPKSHILTTFDKNLQRDAAYPMCKSATVM